MGMFIASLSVQYRDVKHAMGFIMQFLIYIAPVVYPASKVPAEFQSLYGLNPMVGVIEGFRASFIGSLSVPWFYLLEGSLMSFLIFIFGLYIFRKRESVYADLL